MAVRRRLTGGVVKRGKSVDTFLFGGQRQGYTLPYAELLTKAQDSNQLTDPFAGSSTSIGEGGTGSLVPIYDLARLAQLPLENNILRQCVEAYVINIESYGFNLEYIGLEGGQNSSEAISEKQRLLSFLNSPSSEHSLREIRERGRWDKEVIGNSYFEVSRNQRGEVIMFEHIPGITMRLTKRDKEPTEVSIPVLDPDGDGFIEKIVNRCFRRFIQKTGDGRSVYFKEFGDPRTIDPTNGKVDNGLSIEDQATEVIHRFLYTPGTVYGIPRWIGNLPAVLGSRESEIVNLNFFRENAIPAMSVLVSGGALTSESFDRLQQYITAVRGQDAMQRVMVLEAAADESTGALDHSQPAPRIEMKPMISERQQEGLFQEYDQMNMQKIRSSFRLPPIYVGRAEDYTRASAFASMLVAENQIFAPERTLFDDLMNNVILGTYKPEFWKYVSLGPSVAEPESLSRMMDSLGKQGALTPNAVIKIANQMLDIKVESITDNWGDIPFNVIMEYIKQGNQIEGLEEFVIIIDNEGKDDSGDSDDSNVVSLPVAAKKVIRRELRMIASDIKEHISEGLTVARSVSE